MIPSRLTLLQKSYARTPGKRPNACAVAGAVPPRADERITCKDIVISHLVSLSCAAVVLSLPGCSLATDAPPAGLGNYINEEVRDFTDELSQADVKAANSLLGHCFPITIDLDQTSDPELPLNLGQESQPLRTPPPPQRLVRRMQFESESSLTQNGEAGLDRVNEPAAPPSTPPAPDGKPEDPSAPKRGICPDEPPKGPSGPPELPPPHSEPFPAVPLPPSTDFPPIFLCDSWGEPGSGC